MRKQKFKTIIYLISFTVLLTVGIQVYRNVQNYELNKQRLMNEVQEAFDNGVESYYANQVGMVYAFTDLPSSSKSGDSVVASVKSKWAAQGGLAKDTAYQAITFSTGVHQGNTTLSLKGSSTSISIPRDSINALIDPSKVTSMRMVTDSSLVDEHGAKQFFDQIRIALTEDLDYEKLHTSIGDELARKSLNIEFALSGIGINGVETTFNNPEDERFVMSTSASSTYQLGPKNLELSYPNPMVSILKRGMADLIISLLISCTIIGALLYLYRVINQQKQLAEIKNDLISNITHEFKTPIATVGTAIEAISNFNAQNDPGKTKKYLDISAGQLKKLNVMVEKLLETATLDTGALELNKTPVNLSLLLHTMIEKYSMVAGDKKLNLLDVAHDVVIEADAFHLENAISNLIDNAVKYGGEHIRVSLARQQGAVQVIVQDDGGFIEKGDKERVFDKFYRVPKGNRHDVKGFGIGLYYTKKIIEKHGGTIELILSPQSTSFEIAI